MIRRKHKLVDRYRPKSLDEIYGHKKIKERLRGFVDQGSIPDLLLIGKNGVGKTAIAKALQIECGVARQDYMMINASDERGIDTIRKKVDHFCKKMKTLQSPFKILVLDEADNITKTAQKAFRKKMEDYPGTVFILTGNDMSGITRAIQSRCTILQFKGIHYAHMERLIGDVWRKEGGVPKKGIVTAIRQISNGDARKALNTLEGILVVENPTPEDVFELHGVPQEESVFHLIHSALKGDMKAVKIASQIAKESDPNRVIRAMFGIAIRGGRGLDDAKQRRILKAIGYIPGATAEHKLTAIVCSIIDNEGR